MYRSLSALLVLMLASLTPVAGNKKDDAATPADQYKALLKAAASPFVSCLLSPHANTSVPLSAGPGKTASQRAQSPRSWGTSAPHAGHDSSTGQDRPKR